MSEPTSHALDEMSWVDVAAHLARDARLLIPIGALEQHGPHLPLGANTIISTRLCDDLSAEFGVLRAPAMSYGVNFYGGNIKVGRAWAGTATLSQKTLHRTLNELLAAWESHGIREFILITAHRHEPHLDALATLFTRAARVRVVSIWDVRIDDLLEAQPGPMHAGEAETSVMLHLYPHLVRMDRARDVPPPTDEHRDGRLPLPPAQGNGIVGQATLARADKGLLIYRRIRDTIRTAVFSASASLESDTV
jgi:creatinine amidohydrolase